jgi:hypothetical protein
MRLSCHRQIEVAVSVEVHGQRPRPEPHAEVGRLARVVVRQPLKLPFEGREPQHQQAARPVALRKQKPLAGLQLAREHRQRRAPAVRIAQRHARQRPPPREVDARLRGHRCQAYRHGAPRFDAHLRPLAARRLRIGQGAGALRHVGPHVVAVGESRLAVGQRLQAPPAAGDHQPVRFDALCGRLAAGRRRARRNQKHDPLHFAPFFPKPRARPCPRAVRAGGPARHSPISPTLPDRSPRAGS